MVARRTLGVGLAVLAGCVVLTILSYSSMLDGSLAGVVIASGRTAAAKRLVHVTGSFPALTPAEVMCALLPRRAAGAQFGVKTGKLAQLVLETTRPSVLFLVDPYEYSPGLRGLPGEGNIMASSSKRMDNMYHALKSRLLKDGKTRRVRVRRNDYLDELREMAVHSLDFVVLAAFHDYTTTREWLSLVSTRLTPDGVVAGAGYDYIDHDNTRPVARAVGEFMDVLPSAAIMHVVGGFYVLQMGTSAVNATSLVHTYAHRYKRHSYSS